MNAAAEKKAYEIFIKEGMTPAGACGLIGNLEAESDGFYPNRVEYLCIKRMNEAGQKYLTDETYTKAVDDGSISAEQFLHPIPGKQYGYGLAQWTSPGRKAGLYNLAKQKGVSIADLDMQLEFLLYELENSYPSVLKTLKSATSIRAASDVVLKKFEIPADTGEKVCDGRACRGQKFYDDYVKNKKEDVKVEVRMSNCGHDESGRYSGGKAGDQTGTEWYLRSWYSYPWNYILRWKDEGLANLFADLAVEAAQNDCIGYDQGQRTTFGVELQKAGWRPGKIKTPCEADCSKGTIDLIRAVGYIKGIKELQICNSVMSYTGNMMTWFKSTAGKKYFDILTGKVLTDSSQAKRGDINLNTVHHVNITVDNGLNAGSSGVSDKDYLSKGDNGSAVKTMQTMLIKVGYSCGRSGADGDFGSDTEKALRDFQKATGLIVDGQYGPASEAKLKAVYNQMYKPTEAKPVEEVAKEVIAGKWNSGEARKEALAKAGYDYNAVQAKVNELLKGNVSVKSVTEVAREVIAGKWGNGEDRKMRLKAAGYDPTAVQKKVNEIMK